MARTGSGMCRGIYMGRINYHTLYDAESWREGRQGNLFPVLVGWILFQLHHTLCVGGTAGSDILYEKKEDTNPCFHTGAAHSDDHLQAGAGTSGTWNSYIWTEFYTYIYR